MITSFTTLHRAAAIIALLLALTGAGLAQETTGTLRGQVTDPTGASIPNATVEVSGPTLMRTLTVTTDTAGSYTFSTLPPGTYAISTTAKGFTPAKKMNILLAVGKVLRVDFPLGVGTATETVEISAEAVAVDVSQSTVQGQRQRGFHRPSAQGARFRHPDRPGARRPL